MVSKPTTEKIKGISLVNYIFFFCGMGLGVLLILPIIAGIIKIIFIDGKTPSSEASMGLSVASVALGAVVLWFADRSKPNKREEQEPKEVARRGAVAIGTSFVFAALCFALFALLSPIFPDAIQAQDFFSKLVKWVGALSFIGGSTFLGLTLCISLFDVWFWNIGR